MSITGQHDQRDMAHYHPLHKAEVVLSGPNSRLLNLQTY